MYTCFLSSASMHMASWKSCHKRLLFQTFLNCINEHTQFILISRIAFDSVLFFKQWRLGIIGGRTAQGRWGWYVHQCNFEFYIYEKKKNYIQVLASKQHVSGKFKNRINFVAGQILNWQTSEREQNHGLWGCGIEVLCGTLKLWKWRDFALLIVKCCCEKHCTELAFVMLFWTARSLSGQEDRWMVCCNKGLEIQEIMTICIAIIAQLVDSIICRDSITFHFHGQDS